jgi:hypothetical protein
MDFADFAAVAIFFVAILGLLVALYSRRNVAAVTRNFATSLASAVEGVSVVLGSIGLIVAAVIIASQSLEWLQFGTWPVHPVSEAFDKLGIEVPQTTWVGGQKIIDSFASTPLSLAAFLAGILGMILRGIAAIIREDARGAAYDKVNADDARAAWIFIFAAFAYLFGGLWALSALAKFDENSSIALSIVWLIIGVVGFIGGLRAMH